MCLEHFSRIYILLSMYFIYMESTKQHTLCICSLWSNIPHATREVSLFECLSRIRSIVNIFFEIIKAQQTFNHMSV